MKRIAAAAAFLLVVSSVPAEAAMLRPIDHDGLNLRSGPGTEHAIVGGLSSDQEATVLGKQGDWYRVRLSSGTEGWVAAWFSRILLEDEERYAVVDTDVLNVRREPELTAPVLARVVQDQYLRLLEMLPEWWRIRLDDGTEGWVSAQYMKRATAAPPPGQGQTGTTPGTTTPPVVTPPDPGTIPLPPGVSAQPPAAPAGTVPALAFTTPKAPAPMSGKVVQVKAETGVYAGPNSEASRLDTVRPNETLKLVDAAGGWIRVETPRAKGGWVPGSLAQVIDGNLRVNLSETAWSIERAGRSAGTTGSVGAAATLSGTLREVTNPKGINLYLIPATGARVVQPLPQGEQLQVLDRDGTWFKVKTAEGRVGWVQGSYTAEVAPAEPTPTDEPDQPATPSPAPTPPASSAQGFKVSMTQPFTGAFQLDLQAPGQTLGQPILEGSRLLLPFQTGEVQERTIPLGLNGVERATVTATGLWLDLVGQPALKVEVNAAGRLSLSVRPVLQAVTEQRTGGKSVFHLAISGHAAPVARAEGKQLLVELPGAVLGAPVKLTGLQVLEQPTGIKLVINRNQAFALKRSEQGFDLELYPAGLAGKVIMLDPGHGGDDGGAVSRAVGVVEKEVNLQVALRLRALLEAKGAKVYMTRATDQRVAPEAYLNNPAGEPRAQLDLQYRTLLANELKVDLFLSVHHNAGVANAQGTETYYTSTTLNGERSQVMAGLIQEELVKATGLRNRGAKDNTFYVTRNTDAPAALIEVAFINNPDEGAKTKDPLFQERVAQAIVRALERLYAER